MLGDIKHLFKRDLAAESQAESWNYGSYLGLHIKKKPFKMIFRFKMIFCFVSLFLEYMIHNNE